MTISLILETMHHLKETNEKLEGNSDKSFSFIKIYFNKTFYFVETEHHVKKTDEELKGI